MLVEAPVMKSHTRLDNPILMVIEPGPIFPAQSAASVGEAPVTVKRQIAEGFFLVIRFSLSKATESPAAPLEANGQDSKVLRQLGRCWGRNSGPGLDNL